MKFLTAAGAMMAVMGAQAYDSCHKFDKADQIQTGIITNNFRSSRLFQWR